MDNIIAIYGQTCTLKTETAQEISRFTGFKVVNRGELATTRAKAAKLPTAHRLPAEVLKAIDGETLEMTRRDERLMMFESSFMDAVLKDVKNVFFVRLVADQASREKRWHRRKEEGGGRTRQLGESVAQRDMDDAVLRVQLYGSAESGVRPAMEVDTSQLTPAAVAARIWERFQSGAKLDVVTLRPPMDKAAFRAVSPGPATGVVKRYDASYSPFGGYIADDKSGVEIYVHKSALKDSGLDALRAGQRVAFDIVEDGFGGFKCAKVRGAE